MGLMPALPNMHFGLVSVHDVARAHLLAMTLPEAAGKRFMVTNGNYSFKQVRSVCTRKQAKYRGFNILNSLFTNCIFSECACVFPCV